MPSRGKLVLVTGAARSGKSYFAEKLAAEWSGQVTYIATCVPGDDEMRDRVARHQDRRPSAWLTIEEPIDPSRVIQEVDQTGQVILLDCLTLLVSNWTFQYDELPDEEKILDKISELAIVSREARSHIIVVTNEVGWGIVPGDPLSRLYRDIIGRANQVIASHADQVFLTVAGIPVDIKSLARGM